MSFVKIQANQSTISASQNLMDFEVPEYIQGIDLEESFININYRIESTETTPASGTGVHNYIKLFNGIGAVNTATKGGSASLFNSALVRNIVLSASKGGQLESIQRADLYNQVKQQFTKNIADIQGEGSHSIRSLPEQYNYPMDQSRNLLTEGTVVSTEKVGVMRIPLKECLGLGSSTLNLTQLGALRVHVEANLNKFTLKEVPTFNGSAIKGSFDNYWKQDITLAVGVASPVSIVLSGESAALGPFAFISKKNAPFWVGQKVSFTLNGGATNTANEVVISSIVWNATSLVAGAGAQTPAGLQATITFVGGASLFAGVVAGAGGVTSIKMFPVYAAATLLYTGAEMVCKTVVSPPQAKGIQYRTVHTIQDFAPASTSMNRTYEVPRNAIASLVCFDTATSSTEFSNSFEPNLTSYQAYVDNVGMTDRAVNIKGTAPFTKDPLHGIILEKTLEEMGLEYKNNLDVLPKMLTMDATTLADASVISAGGVFAAQQGTSGVTVIPIMYEQTGISKMINLDLQRSSTVPAAVGSMNLVMFQQVERVIDY